MRTYSAFISSQLLSNHSNFSHPHSSNSYQSKEMLTFKYYSEWYTNIIIIYKPSRSKRCVGECLMLDIRINLSALPVYFLLGVVFNSTCFSFCLLSDFLFWKLSYHIIFIMPIIPSPSSCLHFSMKITHALRMQPLPTTRFFETAG